MRNGDSEPYDMSGSNADEIPGKAAPCLPSLDLVELAKVKAKPQEFAISEFVPAGEVTLFTGAGSSGKSLLGQQLATAAAAGVGCLGMSINHSPAIYLSCEDGSEQLHFRQERICEALGVDMASLAGKLHLVSRRGELSNELGTEKHGGELATSPFFQSLERTVKETGACHVWLDNVGHLFAGNENDRGEVTRFVNLLNRLAGKTGAAVVLIAHPSKGEHDYSGSTAWRNSVRSQFVLKQDEETDSRTIYNPKANYAQKGQQKRIAWLDWAFVLESELPPDRGAELANTIKAQAENEAFLKCLAEMTRQKRAVSDSKNATNFAPKVFVRMPEGKPFGMPGMERALDRLYRIDRIEKAELWKGADRKPVYGLREVKEGCG